MYCIFQVHVGALRSSSSGTVRLRSTNPTDHPLIDPQYYSKEQDRIEFRAAVRFSRELFEQDAFAPYRAGELLPGDSVQSDEDIDAFVRAHGDSAYHPSCTCKMGTADDKMAVLDNQCKVYGVEGLRVIDASSMPSIVSGNLAAAVMMMAEKVADQIQDKNLPKSTAPVYRPKTLETQR